MNKIASSITIRREPFEVFSGGATGGARLNLMISSDSTSPGRLFYGPDDNCDYDWLEAGQSVRELGSWPALYLKTAYSEAYATVWSGVGFSVRTPSPKIGTSFKGGPVVTLSGDGTPSQLSTTVIGTHALTLAQDPRNHPGSVVWVSTHIDLLPEQKAPDGKPLPGCGPPGGTVKKFPLLHGCYLPVEGFNSAIWCWAEPGQESTIHVYYVKHEFGV